MPARGPNTPAESRDRISISANRRKQNPFEHPAGSSEGCGLKTTRLEVDSPAALAFNKAEGVVRVVSIVSGRWCLRFLSCWGQVLSFAQGCGFPAGRTIHEIDDLQHTYRTTPSGLHLRCASPDFLFV